MLGTVQLINKDLVANSVMAQTLTSIDIACHSYISPTEFLREAGISSPACLLADMTLPEMGPLQLLTRLRTQGYLHPVLYTAHRVEVDSVIELLRHGAFGFLRKPFNQMALLENVQKALELDRKIGPRLERAWNMQKDLAQLGRRERQVFERIAGGETAAEIAKNLGTSRRTIENQRANAYKKLGVQRSADAVKRWAELDLLRSMGAVISS